MAKSPRSYVLDKQDRVLDQFSKLIRNESRRTELNATEQCILQSQKNRLNFKPKEQVRISHYNPNNPLNGSRTWTKTEQEYYKTTGKNPRA